MNPQRALRRVVTPRAPFLDSVVVDALEHVSIDVAIDVTFRAGAGPTMDRARETLGLDRCMWDRPGAYTCRRSLAGRERTARILVTSDGEHAHVQRIHVDGDLPLR
jgi:hypothetical protein